jgi:hypothetical protein
MNGRPRSWGIITCMLLLATPLACQAQGSPASEVAPSSTVTAPERMTVRNGRWEVTVDGRVGFPVGQLKVGEFPTTAPKTGGTPGTQFRLSDLGIHVSESVDASLAFNLTPRDALRASYLYYFLRGSSTIRQSVVFNGQEFTSGRLNTNADFYRLSLAYERTLIHLPSQERLVASVGLTYVNFNPTLTGSSSEGGAEAHGRSNSEDFYRQELPVPIAGLLWDHPIWRQLLLRTSLAGGGLPRINSGRKEGGIVYLNQTHADFGLGLAYLLSPHAEIQAGYQFTYFRQHEKSHEDNNAFTLIDNGLQARFTLRF